MSGEEGDTHGEHRAAAGEQGHRVDGTPGEVIDVGHVPSVPRPCRRHTGVMTRGPFWVEVPRDVVQVAGPDALTYLQGQVSQDLRAAGRRRQPLDVPAPADRPGRRARPGAAHRRRDVRVRHRRRLRRRARRPLNRFKIRVKADVEPLPWRVPRRARRRRQHGPDGAVVGWWDRDHDLLGPVRSRRRRRRRVGCELEAARIEAGWPAMGAEIVPGETIPAETGVVPVAVDFKKGCYPGQELVERMDSRGADGAAAAARPRRRRGRPARRSDRRTTAPRSAC